MISEEKTPRSKDNIFILFKCLTTNFTKKNGKTTYMNIIVNGIIMFADHWIEHKDVMSSVLYSEPVSSFSSWCITSLSNITLVSSGNTSFQLKVHDIKDDFFIIKRAYLIKETFPFCIHSIQKSHSSNKSFV